MREAHYNKQYMNKLIHYISQLAGAFKFSPNGGVTWEEAWYPEPKRDYYAKHLRRKRRNYNLRFGFAGSY